MVSQNIYGDKKEGYLHPSAFILDQILDNTNRTNHAKWHDNQNRIFEISCMKGW